ncbi:sugar ABC transporter substrate-binding protein [Prauserella sp. PE36]|uniref:sugar ABC transporter substrate-binding protein n=1 Tax=Prauserella sp. PE36 TaxID=1504709 RepID=UPI001F15908C|nr:sugar ABC transporter substrate-binding protein [Prauserella sp. PE36]
MSQLEGQPAFLCAVGQLLDPKCLTAVPAGLRMWIPSRASPERRRSVPPGSSGPRKEAEVHEVKTTRPWARGVAAVAAAIGIAACSGEATSSGTGKTLGIVQFSGDDVYSNRALEGAADYAESQGWQTVTVDAKGSVDGANTMMENLVTRGVDAIVVSVFPSSALGAGVAAARQADVPVANWGGGLADGVLFAADTALGDEIAQRVVSDMGGKGELLVLGYRPGLPCQDREKSMDAAVAGTDIRVSKQQITIPGAATSAAEATLGWLASHPKGDTPLAVWSCFDDPATGAVSALRQAGRGDVLSYGLNGTAPAVKLVEKGELTATLWIDGPGQGEELAKRLIAHVGDPGSVEQEVIGGATQIVDKDNVADFLEQHDERN